MLADALSVSKIHHCIILRSVVLDLTSGRPSSLSLICRCLRHLVGRGSSFPASRPVNHREHCLHHFDVSFHLPVSHVSYSLLLLQIEERKIPIGDRFIPQPDFMLSRTSKVIDEVVSETLTCHAILGREASCGFL